jgi:UDP-N-acetylglucosamine acyltransferase
MAVRIHETAVIERGAELGEGVEVGAYAVIEAGARIGRGTRLHPHAMVRGPTTLGEECEVHPFAVVGGPPQAKRHHGGPSPTVIGARNVFREHVTVHGGTEGRATRIGDKNLFMAGAHVAHDVAVGSFCTFANAVQLAGHAEVDDHAVFGGLSGVAQFVRVGESAFVAAGAMCERDVPPFVIVQGDRARVRALNVVGLRRRGVPEQSIAALRVAFRAVFSRQRPRAEALVELDRADAFVSRLAAALERESRVTSA